MQIVIDLINRTRNANVSNINSSQTHRDVQEIQTSELEMCWVVCACVHHARGSLRTAHQVLVLKLLTDRVPHEAVVVDSVESNVIVVDFQQPVRCGRVVTDDKL